MEPSSNQDIIRSEFNDSLQDVPDLVWFKDIKQEIEDKKACMVIDTIVIDDIKEESMTVCNNLPQTQTEPMVKIENREALNEYDQTYDVNFKGEEAKTELEVRNEDWTLNETRCKKIFPNQIEPHMTIEDDKVINECLKMDVAIFEEFQIKNEELDIKEENLEPTKTRYKKIFPNQIESHIKIEDEKAINECVKMNDASYEEFQIENEELDIKEENLEPTKTSARKKKKVFTSHKCQQNHLRNRQKCQKGHQAKDNTTQYRQSCQTIQGASFKSHLQLENSQGYVFKCDQCDYQTIYRSSLKTHLLRHKNPEEVNMFKCDQCDFKTVYKCHLKTHFLRHQNPEELNMFKCNRCNFQTIYKGALRRHLLLHKNPEEVSTFKCNQCNYHTSNKTYLTAHFLRHQNPKERNMFKCDQCEYQTIYKSSLKTHLLRHKNPEEVIMFKCYRCDFQTVSKCNLRSHLLRHKNPKEDNMFKCNQCAYQTVHKNYLKRHLRKHRNPEDMFKCDQCDYQTVRKSILNKHVLRHNNPEKVQCSQCNFQTIYKTSLKRHVLRKHNPEDVDTL